MPAIHIQNLTKSYSHKISALKNVSFDVAEGEVFGVVGPDGAGKSTLFNILTTLILPDSGEISVLHKDIIKDYLEIRKSIGYLPGTFSLYPDLTVEKNLIFFATMYKSRIKDNMSLIRPIWQQLLPFKNRYAGKLSGGMKQKLALCCALVHQPSMLFLDEPTTGVDPVSRKEFWEMLLSLRERQITIVAATPYLDQGQLMGIDTPEAILTQFRDIFNPPKIEKKESPSSNTQTENVIDVEHLVKAFGSFHAVDDISFSVKRGEIFGFLGANGAGKTTAMHMLTGLNQPTSGHGHVAGFDVSTEYEQIKKHIGYMSQKFSLYEDLTVKENIRLFAGIYGMNDRDIARKTDELLERLEFSEHKNDIVASLPLGWKQKLAFSVSIFHEPDVVFLDEPTGGVDPATRRQFWQLIYDAAARGITVFVTTHYMDEAEYCDRISIMVDGKISAMGTPAELKQKFNKPDMDSVFTYLARQAKRSDS